MKRTLIIILAIMFMFATIGCGDNKTINGKTYTTYGLLNKEDNRNENIQYKIIYGNIVWSVILCQTIIAPIYFLGFSMYEPIRVRTDKSQGVVN